LRFVEYIYIYIYIYTGQETRVASDVYLASRSHLTVVVKISQRILGESESKGREREKEREPGKNKRTNRSKVVALDERNG